MTQWPAVVQAVPVVTQAMHMVVGTQWKAAAVSNLAAADVQVAAVAMDWKVDVASNRVEADTAAVALAVVVLAVPTAIERADSGKAIAAKADVGAVQNVGVASNRAAVDAAAAVEEQAPAASVIAPEGPRAVVWEPAVAGLDQDADAA